MYKTIRHGENSLQYTILPQNDDFRIEGKLTSAESSCSNGRKSKTKRPRRRSFFAYLGLLFVCTVIVGAVLIPFLVSADCLLNPTDWFLSKTNDEKHNKPISTLKSHGNIAYNNAHHNFMGNGINIGKTVKIFKQAGIEKVLLRMNKTENLKLNSNLSENARANDIQHGIDDEIQIVQQKLTKNDNTTSSINVQSNAQNINQKSIFNNDIEMGNDQSQSTQTNAQLQGDIQAKQTHAQTISFDQSNQNLINNFAENPPNEHFVTEVRFEPVENVSTKPGIVPTIVVTTLRNQLPNNDPNSQQSQQQQQFIAISQSQTAPNVRPTTNLSNSNVAMNNNVSNSTASSSSSSLLMTRIIQVPLLKSAAKKPIIPPVLVKTNSQLGTANSLGSIRDGKLGALATPLPFDQTNVTSVVVKSNSIGAAEKSAKPRDWLNAHWPFVDSSTYFQWSGYKTEDSVLLPALLGFSLIGVILFISVCLVARNKRTIVSSVRKRNRNVSDVEENGAEDNTTLLTTACLSDED